MRTTLLAIALFALAGICLLPRPTVGQIRSEEGGTYAAEQPSILPEEIPPSAAEQASPSVPLQEPDMPEGDLDPWNGTLGGGGHPVGNAQTTSPARSEAMRSTPLQPALGNPPPQQGVTSVPPRQQERTSASPATTGTASAPFTPRTSTKDLLAGMLLPPKGAQLEGAPISLPEAMEGVYGSDRQRQIVATYWDLAVAVANYYMAFGAGQTSPESRAELTEAKLTAVRAQHRLADALLWTDRRLPLPITQPHSGSYNTRFDEIFVGQVSRRAWELNQTLPLMYDLMKVRAEAFAADRNGPKAPAAAERFLDVVREYNLAIAEYALLAAGDSLTGRDLVPLLIRVERGEEEEHVAEADDGLGKTSSRPVDPRGRTPRGTLVDPRVVQTAGEQPTPAADRSVLVQPRHDSPTQTEPSTQPSTASPASDQWRERDPSNTP